MTGPLLVLSAWAVAGAAVTLLTAMRGKERDATPGTEAPTGGAGSTPV
ncbi:hypothetical protein SAMN05216483_5119 [Streptomyces sp. 2131.1]|nr:hypothetical protein SAMN05216483_5119 [Streptomyces sp. 2131.1]